ncbi:tyrosine-type recombinase/integrase [Paenibacillus andongensis]|uniref:tyrosine-type recombinase/integrase n=1 Tax=Paenibacillus andongensis TaxID=2975482 RepID=UPI0021BB735F|nr:site-specific integrase [Paenibacillus andongensis]
MSNENEIRVEIAKFGNEMRYLITEKGIPMQDPCLWLDVVSINSYLTGERYAYALLRYLRFLKKNNLDYLEVVSKKVIEEYIKDLLGLGQKIINIETKMTFTALNTYITVIKSFYNWLEDEQKATMNPVLYSSRRTRQAPFVNTKLLYGQVWNFTIRENVLSHITYRKKRNHLKWYTEKEIQNIRKELPSLRDEVIFMISVETGMRVGEILGLKKTHFNSFEPSLEVVREENIENGARAKTKERLLIIDYTLGRLIQDYMATERYATDVYGTDYLFINSIGIHKGKPLKPRNFLRVLKDAGERSGLQREEIRTHSGRSTRAQQLVELMRQHPETGITPTFIEEEMGWKSERTLKVYVKGYTMRQKRKILARVKAVKITKVKD